MLASFTHEVTSDAVVISEVVELLSGNLSQLFPRTRWVDVLLLRITRSIECMDVMDILLQLRTGSHWQHHFHIHCRR
jgi:hypothetical protein